MKLIDAVSKYKPNIMILNFGTFSTEWISETTFISKANLMIEDASFESKCLSFASNHDSDFHVYVNHNAKQTFSNVSNIPSLLTLSLVFSMQVSSPQVHTKLSPYSSK